MYPKSSLEYIGIMYPHGFPSVQTLDVGFQAAKTHVQVRQADLGHWMPRGNWARLGK
jgi:hypothetical protein